MEDFDEMALMEILNAPSPSGAVHTLLISGADGPFGCPCCFNGQTIFISNPPNLCSDLEGLLTYDEYTMFVTRLNRALKSTHVPMCPLGLFPCGLAVAAVYSRWMRDREIDFAVTDANETLRTRNRSVRW